MSRSFTPSPNHKKTMSISIHAQLKEAKKKNDQLEKQNKIYQVLDSKANAELAKKRQTIDNLKLEMAALKNQHQQDLQKVKLIYESQLSVLKSTPMEQRLVFIQSQFNSALQTSTQTIKQHYDQMWDKQTTYFNHWLDQYKKQIYNLKCGFKEIRQSYYELCDPNISAHQRVKYESHIYETLGIPKQDQRGIVPISKNSR